MDILRYYRRSLAALDALKKAVGLSLGVGIMAPTSPFFGMTPRECDEALAELRKELDHQVVLMLTASFEAVFQTDLRDRIKRRKRDYASKALRNWWKSARRRREKWVDLGSLLDVWKKAVGHGQVIGRMKSLLLFRHWLAHGRYWNDKSGLRDVGPFGAWEIGKAVFAVIPGFHQLPTR
jgi:hypothetical protein